MGEQPMSGAVPPYGDNPPPGQREFGRLLPSLITCYLLFSHFSSFFLSVIYDNKIIENVIQIIFFGKTGTESKRSASNSVQKSSAVPCF